MELTPVDVRAKRFTKVLRGYDPSAVDTYLDEVIRSLESLHRTCEGLRSDVSAAQGKLDVFQTQEETLRKIIAVAEKTSEEIKQSARREADVIIQEARVQAERVMDVGQTRLRKASEHQADLLRTVEILRSQVRMLLQTQLDCLEHGLQQIDGLPPTATATTHGE